METLENENIKNRKHLQNYVVAFKSIAFLSTISGFCLVSICLWVLIALTEEADFETDDKPLASQFRLLTILANEQNREGGRNLGLLDDNLNIHNHTDEFRKVQQKLTNSWKSVSPYFQGSCGLSLVIGLVQVLSSMIILSSSTKGAHRKVRATIWKIVHIVVILLLVICLAIPLTIDKTAKDGGIGQHLETIILKLNSSSTWKSEHLENMHLLYTTVLVDVGVVLLLIVCSHVALYL